MSLFGSILSRIFNRPAATDPAAPDAVVAASAAAPAVAAAGGANPAVEPIDVAAVLGAMAAKHPEKLNWQTSIVDLMKLLDLDSGLGARRELAKELHYSGDTADTAAMNVWLHREVMAKVAANGGKVPAELRD